MISDFKVGEKIHLPMLVRLQKIGTSSNGKPFARGLLEDSSGQIGFICFDGEAVEKLRLIEQPVPFMVSGCVDVNKFTSDMKLQVMLQRVSDLMPEDDLTNLMPVGKFDRDNYQSLLQRYIGMIKNPILHSLVDNIFTGQVFENFLNNPAGMRFHHAYLGGLLQHTVDVTKLAVAMAEQIDNVNVDLVISGALLHDIGKLKEISSGLGFPYTTEGRLLGHITMAAMMVQEQGNKLKMSSAVLEQLLHILISHHGDKEKGSPVPCETKEAFIVHYADELDAIMNQFQFVQDDTWTYNKMLQRFLLDRGV